MSLLSLTNLPLEIIYFIFEYLNKEHIAYAFFGLNHQFTLAVKYFLGQELNLTKSFDQNIFQFCLTSLLPSIGLNLRYLSIGGYPYYLTTYIKYIENYCPNLEILHIYCFEDIRYYAVYLIHHRLMSLNFMYDNKIVGKEINIRLFDDPRTVLLTSSLVLHLSSMNDLNVLKRFSQSSFLSDGFYMIECLSTGEWLTDSRDDLCIMSRKVHHKNLFLIKQIDIDRCSREYELYNKDTQCRLTVLIPYEEEHWLSSSILSTQRKESSDSCSSFTFERIENNDQFYIRPCYSQAKRLQVCGKRIIVSLCDNENTLDHCFKLHCIL